MSTTVELVRANERYARLRAAVEALAAEWDRDGGAEPFASARLRGLLEDVDS